MAVSRQFAHMRDAGQTDAKEIASTVRLIGPQEAAQMLETMKYEHQRKVSGSQIKALAEEMTQGRFIGGTTIRIAYLEDRACLIDGQHRLGAVVASKKPQIFTVVEENAPSAEYVAWAYGNLDIGRKRSLSDLTSPLQLPERLELTPTQINLMGAAIDVLAGGMTRASNSKRTRLDKSEKVRLIELYAPYMRRFSFSIAKAPRHIARPFKRSYMIAVALLSFRFEITQGNAHAPSTIEFWRGTAMDDGLRAKDPRKIANRHLLTTTMQSASSASQSLNSVTTAYGARFIAVCYDSYMKSVDRSMGKVHDTTAPFKMAGVPSDHREWLV